MASFVVLFAPLFHPHKFQVSAPNYLEDSLEKLKVAQFTKAITELLMHYQMNTTLQYSF